MQSTAQAVDASMEETNASAGSTAKFCLQGYTRNKVPHISATFNTWFDDSRTRKILNYFHLPKVKFLKTKHMCVFQKPSKHHKDGLKEFRLTICHANWVSNLFPIPRKWLYICVLSFWMPQREKFPVNFLLVTWYHIFIADICGSFNFSQGLEP